MFNNYETMNPAETLFLMHLADGYAFRNMVNIWKSETEKATMILSPTKITVSFMNNQKCCVHEIELDTREFVVYKYNFRDSDGNLIGEVPITFNTTELFNTTKSIARRDALRIYWVSGSSLLSIQQVKAANKDPGTVGASFVSILQDEASCCTVPTGYSVEPNIRVQAKTFADLCGQSGQMQCASLEIIGKTNSVMIRGLSPHNTASFATKFTSTTDVVEHKKPEPPKAVNMDAINALLSNLSIGDNAPTSTLSLNVVSADDLMTVKVPSTTVKALSKIHNISANGTHLKFYFMTNKPTKIVSPVATYGTYSIFLRNPH